jgi:hypothetical protein
MAEFGAIDRGENRSLLEALLTEIVGDFRSIDGRQQKTSFVIIAACKRKK